MELKVILSLFAGVRNALPEPAIDIEHRERATARAVDSIVGRAGWLRSRAATGRCRTAGRARTALAEGNMKVHVSNYYYTRLRELVGTDRQKAKAAVKQS